MNDRERSEKTRRAPLLWRGARVWAPPTLLGATLAIASLAGAPLERASADDTSFELPVFGETTFSMTSSTTARYRGQNYDLNLFDDDFFAAEQRFDLALQGDELRLEVRVDAFVPFGLGRTVSPPVGAPIELSAWAASQAEYGCIESRVESCYLTWDARPERIALRYHHDDWTLDLGDAQLVLGRGVALSFRKVDVVGIDTALRGAHVGFDDGHFRFRLHAGLANPQNQDPITLRIFQDPADVVAAGTVGLTFGPGDAFAVSGHAVHVSFEEQGRDFFFHASELVYDRSVDVIGWTFEAPALADGALALYAEANALRRSISTPTPDGGLGPERHEFGRGVYASAQLALDDLTLLLEWKDYTNFLVAPSTLEGDPWRIYSAAPLLELDGPQRLRAIGNQRGGSLRVDYAFSPGPWQASINASIFGLHENPNLDPWDGILVSHAWLTVQRRQEYGEDPTWSASLTAGYREESLLHDVEGTGRHVGDMDRRIIHGQIDATIGSGEHSLELSVDHRYEQEVPFDAVREFQVGGVSATYTYDIHLALALTLRWSDYKSGENAQRALRDYNFMGGMFYPSLEVRWNFDPGTFLKLFLGSTPGGTLCSGGVCREVPPYEGAILQFVARI